MRNFRNIVLIATGLLTGALFSGCYVYPYDVYDPYYPGGYCAPAYVGPAVSVEYSSYRYPSRHYHHHSSYRGHYRHDYRGYEYRSSRYRRY